MNFYMWLYSQLKSELEDAIKLLHEKEHALQSALTQSYNLQRECKRLEHLKLLSENNSKKNSVHRGDEGGMKLSSDVSLRGQVDALRQELHKEKMLRSKEHIYAQNVIAELELRLKEFEITKIDLKAQVKLKCLNTLKEYGNDNSSIYNMYDFYFAATNWENLQSDLWRQTQRVS